MREYKYYEFTITKRGSNEVLSKRVVKGKEDIRALHELEWLYFKFEVAKLDVYARQNDYNIKSRKLTEEEIKPYERYPFSNFFENQIKQKTMSQKEFEKLIRIKKDI